MKCGKSDTGNVRGCTDLSGKPPESGRAAEKNIVNAFNAMVL